MNSLKHFTYWCNTVLPLVYDDSLSYYELLCKVVKYINDLISQEKIIGDELEHLISDMTEVKKWIDNFDTSTFKDIIEQYIATMIFLEISDSGYIVYYIPESWKDVTFRTTELDINVPDHEEYGHLVLIY